MPLVMEKKRLMDRRSFLKGMAGILAAGIAPAVLPSGIIMPIRQLIVPSSCMVMLPTLETGPGIYIFSAFLKTVGGEWQHKAITVRSEGVPRFGVRTTGEVFALGGEQVAERHTSYHSKADSALAVTIAGRSDGYVVPGTEKGLEVNNCVITFPITGDTLIGSRDFPGWFGK